MEDSHANDNAHKIIESRRSSDFYLIPSTSESDKRRTLLETNFDNEIVTRNTPLEGIDEVDHIRSKDTIFLSSLDF